MESVEGDCAMTYSIAGLDPTSFGPLFAAERIDPAYAKRVVATSATGFPCRVSLEDAEIGDHLMLVHHVSNDVAGPFRMAHAIYVRDGARQASKVHDTVPPMLNRRTLSLRAFDGEGMLRRAMLAEPGGTDERIRELFADSSIAYIHAHNAAYGCFLAAIERSDD
jgi:hypothetical protein